MARFQRLRLDGFLSFEPGSEALDLEALNVLIGPDASGKSNVLEAFELLRAAPANLADAFLGGEVRDWLWKGGQNGAAILDFELEDVAPDAPPLRYRLEFEAVGNRVEIVDETLEDAHPARKRPGDAPFYYRYGRGKPAISELGASGSRREVKLNDGTFSSEESVLSQIGDLTACPEVTGIREHFGAIETFRDWTFGRGAPPRRPAQCTLPDDRLVPGAANLALVLDRIHHGDGPRFDKILGRFFPRFERMSTRVEGGSVRFFLHETGFDEPIPATRLSDGTIRFMALLAILLSPSPPPLVCIEEPELGLHPDSASLVADLLVEASERMQLVVTTNSEAVLSGLGTQAEAVVTCERLGGGTVLERLDPGRLAHWFENYTLGDMWSMGELGANP